jgi:hypothetical protein
MNGHRCPSIPQGEWLSVQFTKLFLRKLFIGKLYSRCEGLSGFMARFRMTPGGLLRGSSFLVDIVNT